MDISNTIDGNIQRWKETIEGGYFDKHRHYKDRPYSVPSVLNALIAGMDAKNTCLEIGAGYGRIARSVASHFHEAHGCDISEKHFPALRALGIKSAVVSGTGSLECYNDDQFDLVYSMNVLQHLTLDQVRLYLKESWRIVRPGGRIFHYLLHQYDREGGTWPESSLDFTYSVRPEVVITMLDDCNIPSRDVKLEPSPNKRMTYIWLIAHKEVR